MGNDTAEELQLRYLVDAISTATPVQRLMMLFDGLLSDLGAACEAFPERDWKRVNDSLVHAQQILFALRDPLDRTTSLGENLYGVYTFCIGELIAANLHKDPGHVDPVRLLVEQIASANRTALASDLAVPA